MKKQKILVTGGAGFIGANVVNLLIGRGFNVIIVDNLSTGYKRNINSKAKFFKADITNFRQLEKIFMKEKPDKVVHAAAQVQVVKSMTEPQEDARINIIGGINVLECSRRAKVKKFVYLSTGGALYGEPEYLPADENHPIHPISCYGTSKRAFEYYLYLYNANYGTNYVGLRFSNVYGPYDNPGSGRVIPNFIMAFFRNKAPFITGDGKQGRDFIYVGDVAQAVLAALHKSPKEKFFNVGTEKLVTVSQVYTLTKKILKSNVKARYTPARKGEVQQIYLKCERARKYLGWRAKVAFPDGMKKTIDWFRANCKFFR